MGTYYELLGITPDADDQEIKSAYRRKARQCHPDTGQGCDDARFIAVKQAYDTLSDHESRSLYDGTLRRAASGKTIPVESMYEDARESFDEVVEAFQSGFTAFDEIMRTLFQRSRPFRSSHYSDYRHRVVQELSFKPRPEIIFREQDQIEELFEQVFRFFGQRRRFF